MKISNSVPFRRNEFRRGGLNEWLVKLTTFMTAVVLILASWMTVNIAFAL